MKKSVLALALAFSASAMAANPVANVVWQGFVPGSVAGDELIITGLAGQAIENGQLIVATDGTFTSTAVTVEAHINDGDADAPVVGAITNANWTLTNAQVMYSTGAYPEATLSVQATGADWVIGDVIPSKESLNLTVAQATAVDTKAGGTVQAQVTIVAEKA